MYIICIYIYNDNDDNDNDDNETSNSNNGRGPAPLCVLHVWVSLAFQQPRWCLSFIGSS